MGQVAVEVGEDVRSAFDLAQEGVARPTQQPPHAPSVVAVVDYQRSVGTLAEQAPPTLSGRHLVHLLRCEPVLPSQPRPLVLGFGGLRVPASPLSEAFVPSGLVGLRVRPTPLVRALLAVRAEVLARAAEVLGGLRLPAVNTRLRLHLFSITVRRAGAGLLDAPCHADVLLELANALRPTSSENT